MGNERAILCGDAVPGRGKLWEDEADPVRLRLEGPDAEVRLRIDDISQAMATNIPPRFVDLMEIATYVYCADQAVTRGGAGVDNLGADWRRTLRFRIPVRDLDFWRSARVLDALCGTLGFLSEDEYHFDFLPPRSPTEFQYYMGLGDSHPQGNPEEVVLFSGGLDSLGGAIHEAVVDKRRVALVMHRPTEKLRPRHDHLQRLLDAHAGPFRPRYFPVTINKQKGLSREYTQRSRSFLYASLGATVARLYGIPGIRFYENGVVSLNLPLSPQVVGAKATRTTHPRVLGGFARLLSLVSDGAFRVENPFMWQTKAQVVRGIADAGCADTIAFSTSCTHTWEMTKLYTHCGTCSQCIDRRFAVLAAGQAENDPAEAYKVGLLTDPRAPGEHRTMLAAYVETALAIARMSPLEFFSRYGEVARVVGHLPGSADAAASRIYDLYQRHAKAVGGVVDDAIAENRTRIRNRELADGCLLRMVCDASSNGEVSEPPPPSAPADASDREFGQNEFRRKGQAWLVRFAGKEDFILLPSRGAAYLHLLLCCPGRPQSAADLVLSVARSPSRFGLGNAGERNDEEALRAYRLRYEEVEGELAIAEENNDEGNIERLKRERGDLAEELKNRGWNGRPRRERDDRDRLRKSFQMAVKRAVQQIDQFDKSLASHLRKAIHCGTAPVYDPHDVPQWEL